MYMHAKIQHEGGGASEKVGRAERDRQRETDREIDTVSDCTGGCAMQVFKRDLVECQKGTYFSVKRDLP